MMKKKMKNKVWMFGGILSICLMGSLTGCIESTNQQISVKDLAKELKTEINYQDELSKLDKDVAIEMYQLDGIEVEDCIVYVSTGATAEEIAVISAKNGTDASKIEEAFEKRVEEQKNSFKDYVPEELKKLDEAVIEEEGNIVVLSISDEDEKAEALIKNAAK
ncbi:DUF4358 domain-containing protein [Velocimicrobium porci]|uniref:DUF4358 domain-containing protein n=1 Tax=Velocimicrobium porci TaxID=2606634 RepID=A0A6L5Y1R9_9FIRM|nr:DUF4358 domain-containing protein [Velocimicrobium porci]MSS64942.1 DUF4358 domain-containing protein [Velocimicrobium porci]